MKRFLLALVCLSALTVGTTKDALAEKPVETVTMDFARIQWTYTPLSYEEFIFWYFIVGY